MTPKTVNPDEVRIGDFTQPIVPKQAKGTSPAKDALESAEKRLGAEASSLEEELRPMASYEEKLKEVGVTREQAARVIDAVLMRGYYAEDVQLTKTVKARFRTRNARDIRRAQEYIEAARPAYDAHYQELLGRQLLAASLEQFGNDKLPHPDRRAAEDEVNKAHADRLSFVDTLSDPALRLLMQKLIKFDRKVSAILEETAVENF
jgi:hypothetical protein